MSRSNPDSTITVPRQDLPVAIRRARPDDRRALERLAELDSNSPLEGAVLLAEVAGELRAARSLQTAETIADPFHHTAHLRPLLFARAAQIAASAERRGPFAILRRRLYARAEAR